MNQRECQKNRTATRETTAQTRARRTAAAALLTLALLAAPAPAHAGCFAFISALLERMARNSGADDPAGVFAGLAPDSTFTVISRDEVWQQFAFKGFDKETGALVLRDANGHEVHTTLPDFLASLKEPVVRIVSAGKPVSKAFKVTTPALQFPYLSRASAELGGLGLAVLTGAEADQVLAREFRTFWGPRKAVFDPKTKRLLIGSKATLEGLLGELDRARAWGRALGGGDPVVAGLAQVLASGAGAVSPELESLLKAAVDMNPASLKEVEARATDWPSARDASRELRLRLAALEDAAAKAPVSDAQRPALDLAVSNLKARATEGEAKLATFKAPQAVPGKLGTLAAHAQGTIPEAVAQKAVDLALKYGTVGFTPGRYIDLVQAVFAKIKSGTDPPLKAADTMAQFGMELEPLLAGLPDQTVRSIQYSLAEAVQTLEAFRPADYVKQPLTKIEAQRANYIHFSQYPEYVQSYVDRKPPYTSLNYKVFGILSIGDIRDAASHNMWPLLLEGHDVRHVHYALGHPRAAAAYFMSARSQSPLRYAMVSALYEGVDIIQYMHESGLAKYMKKKMNMDLEQGMVYLARVPEAELERIAKACGYSADIHGFAAKLGDWRPKETDEFKPEGQSGSPNGDLDNEISHFELYGQKPGTARYTNYARRPPKGGATSQDDSIHVAF